MTNVKDIDPKGGTTPPPRRNTTADEDFYGEQIFRLRALPFFPSDEVARGELLKALWRHAQSPDHARRMIDYAIENGCGEDRRCPAPPDFKTLAAAVAVVIERPPDGECRLCGGRGWVMKQIRGKGIFADRIYEAAGRCSCRKAAAQ